MRTLGNFGEQFQSNLSTGTYKPTENVSGQKRSGLRLNYCLAHQNYVAIDVATDLAFNVGTPFAELIRQLAAEFRGDASKEVLLLTEMPEISINSRRSLQSYGIKAEKLKD